MIGTSKLPDAFSIDGFECFSVSCRTYGGRCTLFPDDIADMPPDCTASATGRVASFSAFVERRHVPCNALKLSLRCDDGIWSVSGCTPAIDTEAEMALCDAQGISVTEGVKRMSSAADELKGAAFAPWWIEANIDLSAVKDYNPINWDKRKREPQIVSDFKQAMRRKGVPGWR